MKILIVEDEVRLAMALQQILTEAQYLTQVAHDGNSALTLALYSQFDLILLDVMLPGMDGFAVASELRRRHVQTPVLMLTARDSVGDKVQGLDSGADDYLTKPFDQAELLARIRALVRRQTAKTPEEMAFGDLVYIAGQALLRCGGKEVRLNRKESEILKLFFSYPRFILSKDEIITKVWGYDTDTSDNNVEAYISFLRKKFLFLDSRVRIISIKKQGYLLEYEPC